MLSTNQITKMGPNKKRNIILSPKSSIDDKLMKHLFHDFVLFNKRLYLISMTTLLRQFVFFFLSMKILLCYLNSGGGGKVIESMLC